MSTSVFQNIKSDMKILIAQTKNILEEENTNETIKGLAIVSAVAASNSLYEKLLKDILKNHLSTVLSNDETKDILLYFLYKNGKSFGNLVYSDLPSEIIVSQVDQDHFKLENFIADYKSLKNIPDINLIFLSKIPTQKLNYILKKTKINLTLDNLTTQLSNDYTDMRTKVIHGDYKDFRTAFYLWKTQISPFLYRLYLIMNLIQYSISS